MQCNKGEFRGKSNDERNDARNDEFVEKQFRRLYQNDFDDPGTERENRPDDGGADSRNAKRGKTICGTMARKRKEKSARILQPHENPDGKIRTIFQEIRIPQKVDSNQGKNFQKHYSGKTFGFLKDRECPLSFCPLSFHDRPRRS